MSVRIVRVGRTVRSRRPGPFAFAVSLLLITRVAGCADDVEVTPHRTPVAPSRALDATIPLDARTAYGDSALGVGRDATSGSSASAPHCEGDVIACALFASGATCASQLGCAFHDGCSGARTCGGFPGVCGAIEGCFMLQSAGAAACSGSARNCASYLSSTACSVQLGCSWSIPCEGRAQPCESFRNAGQCSAQQGCRWR
jgi:hypothetical protein